MRFILTVAATAAVFGATSARALTVEELYNMRGLTPERFIALFEDFKFQFHDEVQDHEVFLRTKSGDCDDFSTLAADVLRRHGYTPRLIAVRMKGETHVVCYIVETKSYLDYNFRKDSEKLVPTNGAIKDIARKVGDSFGRDWIATYEFTFRDGVKRLVRNIVSNPSAG